MKTAISIPDDVFREADKTAEQLGLARSQLYVKAIQEFIEHHNKEKIREKLDAVYGSPESREEEFLDVSLNNLRKATEHDSW